MTPEKAMETLPEIASKLLIKGGLLIVHGPFKRSGKFSTQSNADWHDYLIKANKMFGLRDLDDLETNGKKHNLKLDKVDDAPANNFVIKLSKI